MLYQSKVEENNVPDPARRAVRGGGQLLIKFKRYRGLLSATASADKCTGVSERCSGHLNVFGLHGLM